MAAPVDLELKKVKEGWSIWKLLLRSRGVCEQESRMRPKCCRKKEALGAWGMVSQSPKKSLSSQAGLGVSGWLFGKEMVGIGCIKYVATDGLSLCSDLQRCFH